MAGITSGRPGVSVVPVKVRSVLYDSYVDNRFQKLETWFGEGGGVTEPWLPLSHADHKIGAVNKY
jgi:hypothetical protein